MAEGVAVSLGKQTYSGNEKLAPLVREISWTHNLLIMSQAKSDEAREFYLMLCNRNNYTKRELERQMDSMLFERTMISDEKNKLFIEKIQDWVHSETAIFWNFWMSPKNTESANCVKR